MEITVNNQVKSIEHTSLISLIGEMHGTNSRGIAVAVNQSVIPKALWQTTALKEGDSVLIIKATQGG